tara:strand:+ start:351 stop:458 length:108 start_codon:yes stop_codon:yes gene_type:complete
MALKFNKKWKALHREIKLQTIAFRRIRKEMEENNG